jgi:hypothetical protein
MVTDKCDMIGINNEFHCLVCDKGGFKGKGSHLTSKQHLKNKELISASIVEERRKNILIKKIPQLSNNLPSTMRNNNSQKINIQTRQIVSVQYQNNKSSDLSAIIREHFKDEKLYHTSGNLDSNKSILGGGAGAGKTTNYVELVAKLSEQNISTCIFAKTNEASNSITYKLESRGVRCVQKIGDLDKDKKMCVCVCTDWSLIGSITWPYQNKSHENYDERYEIIKKKYRLFTDEYMKAIVELGFYKSFEPNGDHPFSKKFPDFFIIDEAQDFSPSFFKFCDHLCEYSKLFMVVGDVYQNLHGNSNYLSEKIKDEKFTKIRIKHNNRNGTEIVKFFNNFHKFYDTNYPEQISLHGQHKGVVKYIDIEEETDKTNINKYCLKIVKEIIKFGKDERLSITIIDARYVNGLIGEDGKISNFYEMNINKELEKNGIKERVKVVSSKTEIKDVEEAIKEGFIPIVCSQKIKGREFDTVFLINIDQQNKSNNSGIEDEINKMSVACSRAINKLYIFCNTLYTGNKTPLLSYITDEKYSHIYKKFSCETTVTKIIENNNVTTDDTVKFEQCELKINIEKPTPVKALYLEHLMAQKMGKEQNFDKYIFVVDGENYNLEEIHENIDDFLIKIPIYLEKNESKNMPIDMFLGLSDSLRKFAQHLLFENAQQYRRWREDKCLEMIDEIRNIDDEYKEELEKLDYFCDKISKNCQYQSPLKYQNIGSYSYIIGITDFLDENFITEIKYSSTEETETKGLIQLYLYMILDNFNRDGRLINLYNGKIYIISKNNKTFFDSINGFRLNKIHIFDYHIAEQLLRAFKNKRIIENGDKYIESFKNLEISNDKDKILIKYKNIENFIEIGNDIITEFNLFLEENKIKNIRFDQLINSFLDKNFGLSILSLFIKDKVDKFITDNNRKNNGNFNYFMDYFKRYDMLNFVSFKSKSGEFMYLGHENYLQKLSLYERHFVAINPKVFDKYEEKMIKSLLSSHIKRIIIKISDELENKKKIKNDEQKSDSESYQEEIWIILNILDATKKTYKTPKFFCNSITNLDNYLADKLNDIVLTKDNYFELLIHLTDEEDYYGC